MNHERFCYEARESELVIVPGDAVVTARCDGCGAYFNPREMVEVSPAGRYNAYMGTCTAHSSSLLRQPPTTHSNRTSAGSRCAAQAV